MIRITKIYEDGTIDFEADSRHEEELFNKILEEGFRIAYRKGYEAGYEQARGEDLVKMRRMKDELLARKIYPTSI